MFLAKPLPGLNIQPMEAEGSFCDFSLLPAKFGHFGLPVVHQTLKLLTKFIIMNL